MSNLTSSIVRGFGYTLGRMAATSITRPSTSRTRKPSRKEVSLIKEHTEILEKFKSILAETEQSYTDGKLTTAEYNQLKSQCLNGIEKSQRELSKFNVYTDNVEITEEKKGNSFMDYVYMTIGFVAVVYAVLWIIKLVF